MHPLLKSGGAEAPPAPLVLRPCPSSLHWIILTIPDGFQSTYDMKSLPDSIKCDLKKLWVIPKTHNKFSSMPIDQIHEQNNQRVKGSGGAIGLIDKSCCPSEMDGW